MAAKATKGRTKKNAAGDTGTAEKAATERGFEELDAAMARKVEEVQKRAEEAVRRTGQAMHELTVEMGEALGEIQEHVWRVMRDATESEEAAAGGFDDAAEDDAPRDR